MLVFTCFYSSINHCKGYVCVYQECSHVGTPSYTKYVSRQNTLAGFHKFAAFMYPILNLSNVVPVLLEVCSSPTQVFFESLQTCLLCCLFTSGAHGLHSPAKDKQDCLSFHKDSHTHSLTRTHSGTHTPLPGLTVLNLLSKVSNVVLNFSLIPSQFTQLEL